MPRSSVSNSPKRRFLAIFILILLGIFQGNPVSSAPGVEEIGILYVGEPKRSAPFNRMGSDPLLSVSFVLAHKATVSPLEMPDVQRRVRLYMPRTVESLASKFDVLILAHANILAVGPRYIDMIYRSVKEAGIALLMGGSWETFGGRVWVGWGGTSIAELLPVGILDQEYSDLGRLVLDKPEHELLSSIPWNMNDPTISDPDRWSHNVVTVKPGASQLAHLVWPGKGKDPLMVTWELPDQTRVFAWTSGMHRIPNWEFHYDFCSNLMIYLAHRPVPQEIEIVHRARSKMHEIAQEKRLVMDLLEFSESFGANTQEVLSGIGEAEEVISKANEEYMDLRYQDMLETSELIDSMLGDLQQEAMDLKDKALMWVYLVEWLTVTGTLLVCGFILWSVMIQRRLYREVGTTQFEEGSR